MVDSLYRPGQPPDSHRTHRLHHCSSYACPATLSYVNPEITQASTTVRQFSVQLSATRRGARLARLLATEQLRSWGLPFETAAQVVAELASNAALHGRVPGRDFRLALAATARTLRIEVTDTRGDRLPVNRGSETTSPDAVSSSSTFSPTAGASPPARRPARPYGPRLILLLERVPPNRGKPRPGEPSSGGARHQKP